MSNLPTLCKDSLFARYSSDYVPENQRKSPERCYSIYGSLGREMIAALYVKWKRIYSLIRLASQCCLRLLAACDANLCKLTSRRAADICINLKVEVASSYI